MSIAMEIAIFFVTQSLVIIGAIIVAYVRTQVAIARLQEGSTAIRAHVKGLKEDHGNLSEQVTGISIALAKLQGQTDHV